MLLIKSGGMDGFCSNTEEAFDELVKYNDRQGYKKYSIFGPNIMVTQYDDILVNHDDVIYDKKFGQLNIRKLTRTEISQLKIERQSDGKTEYLNYLFFDDFINKYFNEYDIFLDIKNRIDSGMSSEKTAKVIMKFLMDYRDSLINIRSKHDFWNKIYFDSDNPEVIRNIINIAKKNNIQINSMYDYNDFGIKCCRCFYDCIFNIYDKLEKSNITALEKIFVSQEKINELRKKDKQILVWNMKEEDAKTFEGIDYILI